MQLKLNEKRILPGNHFILHSLENEVDTIHCCVLIHVSCSTWLLNPHNEISIYIICCSCASQKVYDIQIRHIECERDQFQAARRNTPRLLLPFHSPQLNSITKCTSVHQHHASSDLSSISHLSES